MTPSSARVTSAPTGARCTTCTCSRSRRRKSRRGRTTTTSVNDFIERVVIQLDAASETRDAIDTAARLGARAQAPLHGIFVEDEDLLRLASLPFARQFTLGAAAEPLTTEHI